MEKAKKMSEAARNAQREYNKNWRKNNPEKIKAAQRRYWEKKGMEGNTNGKEAANE